MVLQCAQILSPLFIFFGACIALLAVRQNIRINKRNKRADAIMHCNLRYDELYRYRIDIMHADEPRKIAAYYSRFWGLKSDEFDYWLNGLIDIDTFSNWLFLTGQAFQENESVGESRAEMSFKDGWTKVGLENNKATNPWFTELVNDIIALPDARYSRTEQILDLLEHFDKPGQKNYRTELENGMSLQEYRRSLVKFRSYKSDSAIKPKMVARLERIIFGS